MLLRLVKGFMGACYLQVAGPPLAVSGPRELWGNMRVYSPNRLTHGTHRLWLLPCLGPYGFAWVPQAPREGRLCTTEYSFCKAQKLQDKHSAWLAKASWRDKENRQQAPKARLLGSTNHDVI